VTCFCNGGSDRLLDCLARKMVAREADVSVVDLGELPAAGRSTVCQTWNGCLRVRSDGLC
jgi:hypothetical protein